MKILWISNIIFPELCNKLGISEPVVGGWMQSGAKSLLSKDRSIELAVVSFYSGTDLQVFKEFSIRYYLVPEKVSKCKSYDQRLEKFLREVNDDFKPDVVHIHGSEYGHSLAQVKACGNKNTIVSIQGLVTFCKDFYLGGIPEKQIKRNMTFRDVVRFDSLFQQQRRMAKRGLLETELLQKINHVIGRTTWDKSCVWSLNPNAQYHFCNETLREGFYNRKWNFEQCHKHTIFLSQGQYPLKGLHQMVKALPLILRDFPDTKVYVAGNDFFSDVPFWRKNGYANYIQKLMKKLGVADKFNFLGQLTEDKMIEQYLQSHVFVCPSAIENSPNSVGEAQLLGTPVVASYVGGTMDMVKDNETGFLYRFEEVSLLAERVCELFADPNLCNKLSVKERQVAAVRHDKKVNAETLIKIYKEIAL